MAKRDQFDVDVLIVGAGPAGLAAAIRLEQLANERRSEISVMAIDKASEIGDHALSGAVMDPRGLDELLPDWRSSAPIEAPVTSDVLWYLTPDRRVVAPMLPPMMNNHGKYVLSVQKLAKWLGGIAMDLGADVFASFAGQSLLLDGDRITGVRTGDKGVDAHGQPKSNYEPGPDILAKIVILCEGARGSLTKDAVAKLGLSTGRDPQVYAVGVKELWQCRPGSVQAGSVIHTLGYPLPGETFGGGFIYGMQGDVLDIGLVTGLDYHDPSTDPHDNLQRYKKHPVIKPLLDGAALIRYGAKSIPEGGLYAMPRSYADGLLVAGDSAGFLNGMRLKGIHLAIKSGMLAAEAAFDALMAQDTSAIRLSVVEERFRASWAYRELYAARNVHAGFGHGLLRGLLNAGLGMFFAGRAWGLTEHLVNRAGHEQLIPITERPPRAIEQRNRPDNVLTLDKLTDVYKSGTMHEEDQPCHLHVLDMDLCRYGCTIQYGNPCQYYCPANVFEPLFRDKPDGTKAEDRLQLNFTNCVHCKTCDIMDPYQNIVWVPAQGGEGPVYLGM